MATAGTSRAGRGKDHCHERPPRRLAGLGGFALAALLVTGAKAAEISVHFTLDRAIEGPAAPFLLPLDRGTYKAEGLNVSIDPGAGPLEPITRVASASMKWALPTSMR